MALFGLVWFGLALHAFYGCLFLTNIQCHVHFLSKRSPKFILSCSFSVLETNPWRETSKPVYVLTHRENQLCTMKTRRNRRSVMVLCGFSCIIVTKVPADKMFFMAVKLKENLECCFPKVESGDLKLENRPSSQGPAQSFRCLLRM